MIYSREFLINLASWLVFEQESFEVGAYNSNTEPDSEKRYNCARCCSSMSDKFTLYVVILRRVVAFFAFQILTYVHKLM